MITSGPPVRIAIAILIAKARTPMMMYRMSVVSFYIEYLLHFFIPAKERNS